MRYVPHTPEDRQEMLHAMGMDEACGLYCDIPEQLMLKKPVNIPAGMDEASLLSHMTALSEMNLKPAAQFLGAGSYRHYIPSAVNALAGRSEFVTAYTPYQPEMSQGYLQAIFEYQSLICRLTGMDVSNASLYDGATAAAEAALMSADNKKRSNIVCSGAVHPDTLAVLRTYTDCVGLTLTVLPMKDGVTDAASLASLPADTACVIAQQPNFYGCLEDMRGIGDAAHAAGGLFVAMVNPISLGLLEAPSEYGADVAAGEGQPLGIPMSFGGPGFGFFAVNQKLMRRVPGRIVGETTDSEGRRTFVLTLQAREQHIRREKAFSNICSNQALMALRASIYLSAMGPQGLRDTAAACATNARALMTVLERAGMKRRFAAPFFHEFVMDVGENAKALSGRLLQKGILSGLPLTGELQNCMLWCATELTTEKELSLLEKALEVRA